MEIQVTIREIITVPDGSMVIMAPTGVAACIRLPSGEEIKPWTCYEIDEEQGEPRDIGHDELSAMGVNAGLDYQRTIEEI